MGRDMAEEALVSHRSMTKLVREGELVAEVDVELVETEVGLKRSDIARVIREARAKE